MSEIRRSGKKYARISVNVQLF